MIEEQMQQYGHDTWGYVIYRTTYESDCDWNNFITQLNAKLDDVFDFYNGKDILDKFTLTVMDDRALFDGASTHEIRRHFDEWVKQNYTSEQPHAKESEEDALKRPQGSTRYRYAVCVDAESLHSIVHGRSEVPKKEPWVKVIKRTWKPDPSGDFEDQELEEPLEGVTQHDVGWMRVGMRGLVSFYELGEDNNYWIRVYLRPPKILTH